MYHTVHLNRAGFLSVQNQRQTFPSIQLVATCACIRKCRGRYSFVKLWSRLVWVARLHEQIYDKRYCQWLKINLLIYKARHYSANNYSTSTCEISHINIFRQREKMFRTIDKLRDSNEKFSKETVLSKVSTSLTLNLTRAKKKLRAFFEVAVCSSFAQASFSDLATCNDALK